MSYLFNFNNDPFVISNCKKYCIIFTHKVYCRVRPLKEDEAESCTEVIKDTLLQIKPPECSLAYKSGHRNAVSVSMSSALFDF